MKKRNRIGAGRIGSCRIGVIKNARIGGQAIEGGSGVSDTTAPTYSSSVVEEATPTVIEVTFSEAVNSPGADYSAGVAIEVNGSGATISTAVRQSDQSVVFYTISSRAYSGDTVTWAYTAASGDIEDQAASPNALGDVSAQTVTNNTTLAFEGPTTTIGTADRDYSTITLWEADLDDDDVYDAGMDAVGEMYNDSVFDESVTINGGGTLGLNSVTLTVAEGERHDGTAGSGVRIVRDANEQFIISGVSSPQDLEVSWLELAGSNTNNTGGLKAQVNSAGDEMVSHHLLIHGMDNNTGAANTFGIELRYLGEHFHTHNNIIYDIAYSHTSNSDVTGIGTSGANNTPPKNIFNNTIHNVRYEGSGNGNAYGLKWQDQSNHKNKNNLVTDTAVTSGSGAALDFNPTSVTSADNTNNASSDATASGTGSLTSITTADQYVSTTGGSEDLHLKTGSDCIDAGTDLGTTPSGVEIDIDGNDRDAGGVTWSISAHEFNL